MEYDIEALKKLAEIINKNAKEGVSYPSEEEYQQMIKNAEDYTPNMTDYKMKQKKPITYKDLMDKVDKFDGGDGTNKLSLKEKKQKAVNAASKLKNKVKIPVTLPGLVTMGAEMAAEAGMMGDDVRNKLRGVIDATPTGKVQKIANDYIDQKDYNSLLGNKERSPEQDEELYRHKLKRGLAFENGGTFRTAALNNIMKKGR